jgi:ribosomal protein L22
MADEKKDQQQKPKDGEAPKRRSTSTRKASSEEKPARQKSEAKGRAGTRASGDAKQKPSTTRRRAPARAKKDADEPKASAKADAPKAEAKDEAATEKAAAGKKPATGRKPAARPARRGGARKENGKPAPARPIVTAKAKYVRSSARKARLVLVHVRGKSIADARAVLKHSPRGVARDLERLLDSAVANAENNHDLMGDDLLVKEVYADEGPTLKRFRARAQGRAFRIRKRTSHLTMTLTPKE